MPKRRLDGFKQNLSLLYIVSIIFTLSYTSPAREMNRLTSEEREAGYELLFDGTTLNGWRAMGNPEVFSVEDGCIALNPNEGFYLRAAREYENFILRLDYKIAPNCNSGIFFHAPRTRSSLAHRGGNYKFTIVMGKNRECNRPAHYTTSILRKRTRLNRRVEWNELELVCNWPLLKVTLNGVVVQDVNCEDDARLRWRKSARAVSDFRITAGKAWFRTIRIKDLGGDDSSKWTPLFNGKDLSGWNIIGDADWQATRTAN